MAQQEPPQPLPAQPLPAQPLPAQPLPAQPLPAQPLPAQPPTVQPPIDYSTLQYKIPLVNEKAGDPVVDLAFSADSKTIAVLYRNSIGFWSTDKGAPLGFAEGPREKFTALAFGSNGLLATGTEHGGVALWDRHDLTGPKLHTGNTDAVSAVAMAPDNTIIASAHRGETPIVVLWDAATGKALKTLEGFTFAPTALLFTADGSQLLSAGGGMTGRTGEFYGDSPIFSTHGEFTRWDVKSGTLKKQVGFNDGGPDCAFSPDGSLLACVGSGAAIGPRSTFPYNALPGNTLWFGNSVRRWRVPGMSEEDSGSFLPGVLKRTRELTVHNLGRPSVAFSPDKRVVAFCEEDGATLWSGGTGRESTLRLKYPYPDWDWYRRSYYPYPLGQAVAFAPNGQMLAIIGWQRAAIWKIVR